ncbi:MULTISPECIES: DUF3344 domain-containing protein [Streptomyces]|jgi:hypothetical protein|uniref:DUF3344 domain-containing protein n=2 Tax=Streptomyces TaxID=1883 RepID=A0A514JUL4_9ACTN|nr:MULTISPECIES: DUF3344 domain-containing protein [Streptomyces]MBA8943898.1 hypothetical protein [Streptomyces calvus]MBA8978282.1 hypothetical protein [Streptomyces calvus]MYS28718.1 DUF3344 domain-containing protein [Streptomyces sp. SID7804]QDI71021.1 DUF3344 domain-containing protein [Streptomyces calvus]GGP56871.1 hypothetical protein GCM10010247_31740 [Streptomyces calvus]
MRHSLGQLLRRATVGALTLAATCVPCGPAVAAPLAPAPEAEGLAFTQRYRAVQHGGIVRAANASATCRGSRSACRDVQTGGHGVNGDFDMGYIDVDKDPNTYNSSRAEVRLPDGARVTYARLYWGGNLLVGEQKPSQDNGRVLVAEPGGDYKELLADTVVGHRVADGADAFQASADVTSLVRDSGAGLYTVAQVNVAGGKSAAGAWGGWTLVVAYENAAEPLRHLSVWDGFAPLGSRAGAEFPLQDLPFAAGAGGRVGLVAYNGDRGTTGDSLLLTAGDSPATAFADRANPVDDVLNSTITDPGRTAPARVPAYANTLGYDSDVFDLAGGLPHAGDRATFRLTSQRDAAWAGVLFASVDARQ